MTAPKRDYDLEEVLAEFRRDGTLIREKARVLTEDGLEKLYAHMQREDMSVSAFLDIMKYLAEIGDLKPKNQTSSDQTGPRFSISINIPRPDGAPPITLEATSTPVEGGMDDMGEAELIGNLPIHQLGLKFDNSDLGAGTDDAV